MSSSISAIMALAQRGQTQAALDAIEQLLGQEPTNQDAQFVHALLLSESGSPDEGITRLESLVHQNAGFQPAWYNLGVLLHSGGDRSGALDAYRHSLQLKPADLPTLLNMGGLCLDLGRNNEALSYFEAACRSHSSEPKAHIGYARALQANGRPSDAIQHLRRLLGQSPGQGAAWRQLGICLHESGDYVESTAALARALECDPKDYQSLLLTARSRVAQGDFKEAERLYERLVDARADDPQVWAGYAAYAEQKGDKSSADKFMERLLEMDGDSASTLFQCAAILSGRTQPEDLDRAEQLVKRALDALPDFAPALDCLALLLSKRGLWDESIRTAERAVNLAPNTPAFSLTLGASLQGAGRLNDAGKALSTALAINRHHPELERQLGLVCLARGEPQEAMIHLDASLETKPNDQRAIAHRGIALQQVGRNVDARAYLGQHSLIFDQMLAVPSGFESREAFNESFAQDIRNHSQLRWEPVGLAAVNGALTDNLLADRTDAILGFAASHRRAVETLIDSLTPEYLHPFLGHVPAQFTINYWATLVRAGGNIETHIHEESWLSGAYYVQLPPQTGPSSERPDGWIEFGRPPQGVTDTDSVSVRLVQPTSGRLLLFPSYLFHRTLPFDGDGDRISVSFDVVPT